MLKGKSHYVDVGFELWLCDRGSEGQQAQEETKGKASWLDQLHSSRHRAGPCENPVTAPVNQDHRAGLLVPVVETHTTQSFGQPGISSET